MVATVGPGGEDDIRALMRGIRQHADAKAIRRELYKGLNSATKYTRGQMTEVIPAVLPRRGGLAASMKSSVRWRTTIAGGKWAGVRLRGSSRKHDARTLTGRRLRHPVFGNRNVWVTQTEGVEPAIFWRRWEQQTPFVRKSIERVIADINERVARSV